ncbi:MAG TPA: diacylglycerol kinase family protein [Aquihabitans sp.]|jgi:diacylglycerol kinase family enzyme|nr:diacylglycerol kinase family protein [Aquihabitans sp.]
MRFCVLVNGGAGSVDEADRDGEVARIGEAFVAAGAEADVSVVAPERFKAAMREAWDGPDRPDAVVVAGGDGTVNCAAGEAVNTDLVLAVLPLGTFNHFAKDLGIPADLDEAVRSLVTGDQRRVDIGEVNGRVFVNNSALGVYPAMIALRDRIRHQRGWGKVRAVPVAALRVMRSFPVHRFDLIGSDGYVRHRVRTPFVFVGNGAYDDDSGKVGERGSLVDGHLGVYVARVVSRWGLVRTIIRTVVSGTQAARDLDQATVAELEVSSKVRRLRVALDGEVCWLEAPLRYKSCPGALLVLAPAPPPADPPASDPNETLHADVS